MRIAGIDPDTKAITIFVIEEDPPGADKAFILNPSGWMHIRLEAKGKRSEDRLYQLFTRISKTTELPVLRGCDWVYVERPFVGPNRKAAIDLGQVVGALRYGLRWDDINHSLVDPSVWKSAMLGTNRVSKDDIKAWAIARFGLEDNLPQDVYDAATIAAYGMTRFAGGHERVC